MSFAQALEPRKTPGTGCNIGHALAALKGEDHKLLKVALANCGPNGTYSFEGIARALKSEGFTSTGHGVSAHVNGRCSCGPR